MSQAQVVASKLRKDYGSVSGFQGTRGSLGKGPAAMARWAHPFPIPNTEVKHRSGEGSPHGREQRAAGLFLFGAVSAPFLLLFYPYFFSGF